MCCAYCHYLNLHNGHKVVPVNDEESLKKENITIDNYLKDFNDKSEKVIELKNKIEKEIIEIDKLYEKVEKETSKSFESRQKKLIKEEKELKDKLQIEVTKTKEKLEEFLSLSNKLIKNYEKINKGIKILENDDKSIIKNLTYIKKFYKNKKEINKFLKSLIMNLKISFKEEKNNIEYEKYYFNGIPSPKDIEFKDINSNNFKITWKIDDLNILNIDNKKMKYKVEIKEENKDDNFKKIYEGNDTNCFIDKLNHNTNYEIRICSLYNDNNKIVNSLWSEIKKIKTTYESVILMESNRYDEFLNKIYEWSGGKNIELLYRGTRDGMSGNTFHNKCNNKGATITLIKNDKGNIFGGYTSISWTSYGNYRSASDSFIFTLTNIYGISPTKFSNSNTSCSIYDYSGYGPIFGAGHDIYIYFSSNSSNFPNSYQDTLGKGKSIFSGDNNSGNFNLKEIEVFKLIKA